ncbi:MAG: replication-associated recombination protein A [Pseudomonadota bacterium]
MDLFADESNLEGQPLAARMRPRALDEYIGQAQLLGAHGPLRRAIEADRLHSIILWGPPGTGKTTLAQLIARHTQALFLSLSAAFSGVKEIRAAMEEAGGARAQGRRVILFVDEVHRFNKTQQDAFLPFVENGTVIFIGATTENPSFELNNALLSRARVYVLKPLQPDDLRTLIDRALADEARGLGRERIHFPAPLRDVLAQAADGDARRALNLLEVAVQLADRDDAGVLQVDEATLQAALGASLRRFDKGGEDFYDQISALHKSVRGSDPDGALYWLGRMLDGGADPLYVGRRLVRMASEDIGNADPRALEIALAAKDAYDYLGSPEGELALAQAIVYLATAPKSNAVYTAWKAAVADARQSGSLEVPLHLRNAPTRLLRELGYGKAYRYDHDYPNAVAPGQSYLPDELRGRRYYQPAGRGYEQRIRERMDWVASLRNEEAS